jgi:hypothetical protein
VEGDIATVIIPAIELPLHLTNCTCADLEDITRDFQFLGYNRCSVDVDNGICAGLHCSISFDSSQFHVVAVVDPCSENVTVTVTDSATGEQVFHSVFSQSSAMHFDVEDGFSPNVYVLINHYIYSMTVEVSAKVTAQITVHIISILQVLMEISVPEVSQNVTILPKERIVLDRSSCPDLGSFPG